MTTQPLTPEAATIIVVAKSTAIVNEQLVKYGIPTDAGNVAPTLAVQVISSSAGLITYLATVPSATLRWCVLPAGMEPSVVAAIVLRMTTYFGPMHNFSNTIRMLNNEYSIDPAKLRKAGA